MTEEDRLEAERAAEQEKLQAEMEKRRKRIEAWQETRRKQQVSTTLTTRSYAFERGNFPSFIHAYSLRLVTVHAVAALAMRLLLLLCCCCCCCCCCRRFLRSVSSSVCSQRLHVWRAL
jgi:hypothetical protein